MLTNIIKGRFLKDYNPVGAEYSYLTDIVVQVGNVFDVYTNNGTAKLVCTRINVPDGEIEGFRDKMRCIKDVLYDTIEEYKEAEREETKEET